MFIECALFYKQLSAIIDCTKDRSARFVYCPQSQSVLTGGASLWARSPIILQLRKQARHVRDKVSGHNKHGSILKNAKVMKSHKPAPH